MNWKQIETSREIRLWVTQIVIPVLGIGTALVATVPEIREKVGTKFNEVKEKFKSHK